MPRRDRHHHAPGLHEDDLVGHALGQEPWEVLSFPGIVEANEVHAIETIWGPQCFTRRLGEARAYINHTLDAAASGGQGAASARRPTPVTFLNGRKSGRHRDNFLTSSRVIPANVVLIQIGCPRRAGLSGSG